MVRDEPTESRLSEEGTREMAGEEVEEELRRSWSRSTVRREISDLRRSTSSSALARNFLSSATCAKSQRCRERGQE